MWPTLLQALIRYLQMVCAFRSVELATLPHPMIRAGTAHLYAHLWSDLCVNCAFLCAPLGRRLRVRLASPARTPTSPSTFGRGYAAAPSRFRAAASTCPGVPQAAPLPVAS